MRSIIAISVLLTASAQAQSYDPAKLAADIPHAQKEYKDCLTAKTVELGAGNTETAETILRGVSAACKSKEDELRALYAQSPIDAAWAESLMIRDRKLGEDAGVAELLQARASSSTH